jgi:hypothetical protein
VASLAGHCARISGNFGSSIIFTVISVITSIYIPLHTPSFISVCVCVCVCVCVFIAITGSYAEGGEVAFQYDLVQAVSSIRSFTASRQNPIPE